MENILKILVIFDYKLPLSHSYLIYKVDKE